MCTYTLSDVSLFRILLVYKTNNKNGLFFGWGKRGKGSMLGRHGGQRP